MRSKYLLLIATSIISISSCVKHEGKLLVYPAKEYVVASEQGCYCDGGDDWVRYFFVREKGKSKWEEFEHIEGFEFDYVLGHEYRINARKIEDPELLKYADAPYYIYLRCEQVLSDQEKHTEGLPDNYIPWSPDLPPPSEYFHY